MVPVILIIVWFNGMSDRENQAHVNPAVFTFFEKVESDCRAEDINHQSTACVEIFKHQKDCKKISADCNSLTYYELLKGLGFQMPDYFEEGYIPK